MSLFEEFKRRKVFRLVATYVVVAWLLIQVVDVIKEPLNLPEWFHTVVIVLVGLMFPVALILSWAYDVTPEGVVKDDGSRAMPVRVDYGKIALGAVIVLGAFLAGNLVTDTNIGQVVRVAGTDQSSTTSAVRIPWQPDQWAGLSETGHPVFPMAMSPAGNVLAYIDRDPSGTTGLRIRHLDRLNSVRLSDTEGAEMPFFSADGQWVGYVDEGVMKRIQIDGGDPSIVTVLSPGNPFGATWSADGTIVFSGTASNLKAVSFSGGDVASLTELDETREEYSHRLPSFIPGHDVLLFSVFADGRHEVWFLDVATGERRYLFDGLAARFVYPGHILYAKIESGFQGSLWAVPFDTIQMTVTGTHQLIQSAVAGRDGSAFASGHTGPIVYLPNQGDLFGELVIVEADGTSHMLDRGPLFITPEFSPDGRSIAVSRRDPPVSDRVMHIYDVENGSSRRIADHALYPLWSPDNNAIVFSKQGVGLVQHTIDSSKPFEVLVPSTQYTSNVPGAWINDGHTLVYQISTASDWDIYSDTVPLDGQPTLIIDDERPTFLSITQDGRWVAYCTWARGIVVGSFPDMTYTMKPSANGCNSRWGPSDEYLYFQQDNKLWRMVTGIGDNTVTFGDPELVADLGFTFFRGFDFDQDGRMVLSRTYYDSPSPPVLLGNWRSALSQQD